jgi:hypothetical protein
MRGLAAEFERRSGRAPTTADTFTTTFRMMAHEVTRGELGTDLTIEQQHKRNCILDSRVAKLEHGSTGGGCWAYFYYFTERKDMEAANGCLDEPPTFVLLTDCDAGIDFGGDLVRGEEAAYTGLGYSSDLQRDFDSLSDALDYLDSLPKDGDRVRFVRDVDCYPQTVVRQGETGTVRFTPPNHVDIELDTEHSGLGEYANELCFTYGRDDGLGWDDFFASVEPVHGPPPPAHELGPRDRCEFCGSTTSELVQRPDVPARADGSCRWLCSGGCEEDADQIIARIRAVVTDYMDRRGEMDLGESADRALDSVARILGEVTR